MIEVICINDKGTKKLIKGQKYTIEALWEYSGYNNKNIANINHNGKFVHRRRVRVSGVNDYFVDRFEPADGRNFYDIPIFGDENKWKKYRERAVSPDKKNYKGQFVKCRYDGNSKFLKSGEIYYVEDCRKKSVNIHFGTSYEYSFKLAGLRNYINPHGLDEIPMKEQRKLKLETIEGKKILSGLNKRKFLYFSEFEQKRIILYLYLNSINNLDNVTNLENVNIVNIMVDAGEKYDIRADDIIPIMDKSLNDISKDLGFL